MRTLIILMVVWVAVGMAALPAWGSEDAQKGADIEGPPMIKKEPTSPQVPAFHVTPPVLVPPESNRAEEESPTKNGEEIELENKAQEQGEAEGEPSAVTGNATLDREVMGNPKESRPVKERLDLGRLEIETEPANATVFISAQNGVVGEEMGVTPLRIKLTAGTYYVTLMSEGFDDAVAEVSVTAQKTTWLRLKMNKAPSNTKRGVRLAGQALFWPGLVTSVTGISLLLADDPKRETRLNRPGGIIAGVGVAMTVLGGVFLGVTYRDKSLYKVPLAFSPLPDGKGGVLFFDGTF